MERTLEKEPSKIGRPRLPENSKKQRVSLSVAKITLSTIDNIRGDMPRSEYIEHLINISHDTVPTEKDNQKKNGIFYTPSSLADFVAFKAVSFIYRDITVNNGATIRLDNSFRIIDPACGDGALLTSVWNCLCNHANPSDHLKPSKILCGIDIEKKAVFKTIRAISSLSNGNNNGRIKVCTTNALYPFNNSSAENGWERIKNIFDSIDGFDLVIANPPWGADTALYQKKLFLGEYILSKGQYDTSDLFIERSLKITKPSGYIAFIIPDSLFAQERQLLREILAKETQIQFIGRFGEKIFNNVNRACAVLICKNCKPHNDHKVECLRLNKASRTNILNGVTSFQKECDVHSHLIPQARFLENESHIFDIDLNKDEEYLLNKIKNSNCIFGDFLSSGRGVEISKRGKICKCKSCQTWLPVPVNKNPTCPHCNNKLEDWDSDIKSIVQYEKSANNVSFIVGESISRYHLQNNRWITLGYDGINYKHKADYCSPKLLVRKTGIGISASIDYSNAYTNQVVYIFRIKENLMYLPCLPLEFFLGILNSRVIHYYLTKTYGEIEWRSHPYVTQKQILAFPLPSIDVIQKNIVAVEKIAELVKDTLHSNAPLDSNTDAEIERLVAYLYCLKKNDYEIIFKSLEDSDELLPIRALKKITSSDIFNTRK
jgi:tRNA1(Val) A37 N6-methylase TrmN6